MSEVLTDRDPRIIDMRPGVMEINGVPIGRIANQTLELTSFEAAARELNLHVPEVIYGCWLAAKLLGTSGLKTWAKELDHVFASPPMNFGRLLSVVRHPRAKDPIAHHQQEELTLD